MFRPRAHALIAARGLAFAGLASLALALVGCGGGKDAEAPGRPVTPYSGRQADLFDDTIEPAAVGLDFDKGYAPRVDKTLRERAQIGDAVIRVRVATVTTKKDGPDATYQLGLHTVEKLMGKNAPPADFTVQIGKTSEAHGIMKNFESRLVGYPFVAFVREFSAPGGEREIHFHLAPDTKEVKMAVSDAQLLADMK
jgi:hypothetical protein